MGEPVCSDCTHNRRSGTKNALTVFTHIAIRKKDFVVIGSYKGSREVTRLSLSFSVRATLQNLLLVFLCKLHKLLLTDYYKFQTKKTPSLARRSERYYFSTVFQKAAKGGFAKSGPAAMDTLLQGALLFYFLT